ncbi:hypothetical protein KIPB_005144 [Kipferlia bialata]|uniref:Uncharacterized protein n=1 Tax=Kipferlia bialata TaxID=797122 RepID=A0A9K3GHY6_9EUKA|nr:hypothetical protein KIPB_005144 [Kipferlia bialata]|eukprot:g5144.t1
MALSSASGEYGHSLCQVDGHILLFGGLGGRGRLGDLWELVGGQTDTPRWQELHPRAQHPLPVHALTPLPCPRTEHVAVHVTKRHSMVLVGGSSGSGPLNDVWEYNVQDNEWVLQPSDVASPQPRHACASVSLTQRGLVLFGGTATDRRYNDLWLFMLADTPEGERERAAVPTSPETDAPAAAAPPQYQSGLTKHSISTPMHISRGRERERERAMAEAAQEREREREREAAREAEAEAARQASPAVESRVSEEESEVPEEEVSAEAPVAPEVSPVRETPASPVLSTSPSPSPAASPCTVSVSVGMQSQKTGGEGEGEGEGVETETETEAETRSLASLPSTSRIAPPSPFVLSASTREREASYVTVDSEVWTGVLARLEALENREREREAEAEAAAEREREREAERERQYQVTGLKFDEVHSRVAEVSEALMAAEGAVSATVPTPAPAVSEDMDRELDAIREEIETVKGDTAALSLVLGGLSTKAEVETVREGMEGVRETLSSLEERQSNTEERGTERDGTIASLSDRVSELGEGVSVTTITADKVDAVQREVDALSTRVSEGMESLTRETEGVKDMVETVEREREAEAERDSGEDVREEVSALSGRLGTLAALAAGVVEEMEGVKASHQQHLTSSAAEAEEAKEREDARDRAVVTISQALASVMQGNQAQDARITETQQGMEDAVKKIDTHLEEIAGEGSFRDRLHAVVVDVLQVKSTVTKIKHTTDGRLDTLEEKVATVAAAAAAASEAAVEEPAPSTPTAPVAVDSAVSDALSLSLSALSERVETLESGVEAHTQSLQSLSDALDTMGERETETKTEGESAEAERVSAVEAACASLSAEVEGVRASVTEAKEAREKLAKAQSDLSSKVSSVSGDVNSLKSRFVTVSAASHSAKAKMSRSESDLRRVQETVKRLEKERDTQRERQKEVEVATPDQGLPPTAPVTTSPTVSQEAAAKVTQQIQAVQSGLASVTSRVGAMSSRLSEAEGDTASVRIEQDRTNDRVRSMARDVLTVTESVSRLKGEVATLADWRVEHEADHELMDGSCGEYTGDEEDYGRVMSKGLTTHEQISAHISVGGIPNRTLEECVTDEECLSDETLNSHPEHSAPEADIEGVEGEREGEGMEGDVSDLKAEVEPASSDALPVTPIDSHPHQTGSEGETVDGSDYEGSSDLSDVSLRRYEPKAPATASQPVSKGMPSLSLTKSSSRPKLLPLLNLNSAEAEEKEEPVLIASDSDSSDGYSYSYSGDEGEEGEMEEEMEASVEGERETHAQVQEEREEREEFSLRDLASSGLDKDGDTIQGEEEDFIPLAWDEEDLIPDEGVGMSRTSAGIVYGEDAGSESEDTLTNSIGSSSGSPSRGGER